MNVRHPLTRGQLTKVFSYWVHALRLADWDLTLIPNVRSCNLGDRVAGDIDVLLTKKVAVIRLLDPEQYPTDCAAFDIELTVVHELLHIHFAALQEIAGLDRDHGIRHTLAIEQPINAIARGLVDARRAAGFPWERRKGRK